MGDLSRSPRAKRLTAADRRDALLVAAEREFAERGFDQARLDDIARATGVTKAVVYRHFASKEELFVAVVAKACDRLEERMAATLALGGSPDVLLSRALRVWFDYVAEHNASFALVKSGARGTEAAVVLIDDVRDRIVKQISAVFNVDQEPSGLEIQPGDWQRIVEAIVRGIVGGAEAVADWWAKTKPFPIEVAWISVTNLYWLGIDRLLHKEMWFPTRESS